MESSSPKEVQDIGTIKEALSIPGFRRLLTAWTFGNVGDSALFLTIAIWIKTLTNNDAYTALIFVALGIPALVAPVFGLLADRFSRRRLVSISNLVVAASVLLLLTVQDASDLWLVYLVTILYSAATYVNAASASGLLRDTIDVRFLAPANGLFTSIDQSFRIIVPLFAAGAFAVWGVEPVLIFTSVMFVLGTVFMQFLGIKETENEVVIDSTWLRTSLQGFPVVYAHKRLWSFLIAFVVVVGTGGALNALVFPILSDGLHLDPAYVSIFTSIQGVAAVSAGLLGASLMKKFSFERLMLFAVLLYALAYAAFAVPNSIVVGIGSAALGMSIPIMGMIVMTIKQTELPLDLQGRSGAAMNVLLNVPQVLTSALIAAVLGFIPYWVLVLVGAFLALFSAIPVARTMRSHGPAAAQPDRTDLPAQEPAN